MNKIIQSKILLRQKRMIKALSVALILVLSLNPFEGKTNPTEDIALVEMIQQRKVTVNIKNRPIHTILNEIRKQSGINFGFKNPKDSEALNNLSINVSGVSVREALETLLRNTPFTFSISTDNVVLIFKKPVTANQSSAPMNKKVTINGTVVDESNNPVMGAAVTIKNTTIGTATVANGRFIIAANIGDIIQVTFLGMIPKEMVVEGNNELKVTLKNDATKISDVVVTGIFNKTRESYTGSVSTVTAKEIAAFKGQNLLHTIKNIDPSINLMINNDLGSNPNILPEINIRGNSSLPMTVESLNNNAQSQLNTPHIIMDGFRISLTKLLDFNDEEIESITILKDASATAIYGSDGANGVIVITTKAPKPGKIKIFAQAGLNLEIPDLTSYSLLNASDKLELERKIGFYSSPDLNENIRLQQMYAGLLNEVNSGVDTYWLSKPLQTGAGQRYNVRMEGGSNEFRWGVAMGYNNVVGVMKGSERKTLNGSVTLTYTLNNVTFRNQSIVTSNDSRESVYGNFSDYTKMNPYWRTHDENGELIQTYPITFSTIPVANPLYNATLNSFNKKDYFEVTNNFSIDALLFDVLKFRAKFGVTKKVDNSDNFVSAKHTRYKRMVGNDYFKRGSYNFGTGNAMNYDGSLTLSYSRTFNSDHLLYAGIDYSISERTNYYYGFPIEGYPNDEMTFLTQGLQFPKNARPTGSENIVRAMGVVANVNYSYKNRYFTDFSYRIDGSSQFGSKKRFAPFWSLGVGWNIHREAFMEAVGIISNLRLKGSYGIVGSQQFSSYDALTCYKDIDNDRYMYWTGSQLMGHGNSDLEWQNTYEKSAGVEVGVFSNRLTASVEFYHKRTDNMLSQIYVPLATGFPSYSANIGEITNRGYEAMLSGYIIRNSQNDITWSVTAKIAYNQNKITKLSDALKIQNEEYLKSSDAELSRLIYEGDSQNAIYVVKSLGIDPSTGQELFMDRFGNVTYNWDARNKLNAGESTPKYRGNINTMLSYKNLSLNLSFGYHWGGQQHNNTLRDRVEVTKEETMFNVDRRVLSDRWMKKGDVSFYKSYYQANGDLSPATKYSSRFVQDDNVFELQSASLQYRLASQWIKSNLHVESIMFGVNMSDVFHLSTIKRERGLAYPFARRVSFTAGLTF